MFTLIILLVIVIKTKFHRMLAINVNASIRNISPVMLARVGGDACQNELMRHCSRQ